MNISLIGKYRSELMGIAITGVMMAHFVGWFNLEETKYHYLAKIMIMFSRLIFTEGFLLLSGFGIYYSLKKEANIDNFLNKRIKRLLIPFVLISFPFYTYDYIINNDTLLKYFLNLSSLNFWLYGNNGMWYISVSLLLYIFSPIIFNFIFNRNEFIGIKCGVVILSLILFNIVINYYYPALYVKLSIGISKIPMYFLGVYLGYLSTKNRKIPLFILCLLLIFICFIFLNKEDWMVYFYESLIRLITIPITIVILSKAESINFNLLGKIFQKLGHYTLELYILHMLFYNFLSQYYSTQLSATLCILISFILCKPISLFVSKLIRYLDKLYFSYNLRS